jgi:signal transduction histidine kinase
MEWLKTLVRNPIEPVVGIAFAVSWATAEAGPVQVSWIPFALIGIALATGRLLPWVTLVSAAVLIALQFADVQLRFGQTSWPAYFGLLLAAIFVGASSHRVARRVALALSPVYGVCVGLLLTIPALGPYRRYGIMSGWTASDPRLWENILAWCVVVALISPAFWFIGFGIRARRDRAESDALRLAVEADLAGAELELRVASERDRIAQDVHDIMAHSLSVIIAQADGARYLSDIRPESTNGSLAAIAQSARESLVEVRMLIDSLGPEPDGHSHPTLDGLATLIERMQSAGLAVTKSTFGDTGQLTAGQEMAVYRIVQESLTNALKHAGAEASATVVFDWRGPGLALTISSTGAGGEASTAGLTRGLRGMRERARLAGGWLAAGPDDDDPRRFIVTAFVPRADVQTGATK